MDKLSLHRIFRLKEYSLGGGIRKKSITFMLLGVIWCAEQIMKELKRGIACDKNPMVTKALQKYIVIFNILY